MLQPVTPRDPARELEKQPFPPRFQKESVSPWYLIRYVKDRVTVEILSLIQQDGQCLLDCLICDSAIDKIPIETKILPASIIPGCLVYQGNLPFNKPTDRCAASGGHRLVPLALFKTLLLEHLDLQPKGWTYKLGSSSLPHLWSRRHKRVDKLSKSAEYLDSQRPYREDSSKARMNAQLP